MSAYAKVIWSDVVTVDHPTKNIKIETVRGVMEKDGSEHAQITGHYYVSGPESAGRVVAEAGVRLGAHAEVDWQLLDPHEEPADSFEPQPPEAAHVMAYVLLKAYALATET